MSDEINVAKQEKGGEHLNLRIITTHTCVSFDGKHIGDHMDEQ